MDKRNRPAKKRNRTHIQGQTISLTINNKILSEITKHTEKRPDKNMSAYIDETIQNNNIPDIPDRREYRSNPGKKTFTLSQKTIKKLKKTGNMSLAAEAVFRKLYE